MKSWPGKTWRRSPSSSSSAPEVARKAQAGQFVVVRLDDKGERIPLTIADWDREAGTITLIFQEVGKTTKRWARSRRRPASLTGPLGLPSEIESSAR